MSDTAIPRVPGDVLDQQLRRWGVTFSLIEVHADARGIVFEPLDPPAIAGQQNVHFVQSAPGTVRGNHYHPRGTEVMSVGGPALVRIGRGEDACDLAVPDGAVYRITIPPMTPHAIKIGGTRPGFLIAFNSEPHNPAAPDVVREMILD
jgi:dTDP-4-dehydrorhamnose 3,5-epimerase-like enzyme